MLPSPHTFHIPVMGTGFTIDSPVKVARFGISSVVSVVDDHLIERMRKHHCQNAGMEYQPISPRDPDARAKRITAYLNLLNRIVEDQIVRMREEGFEEGSDLCKYFEMLPDSPQKRLYEEMLMCSHPAHKEHLKAELRFLVVPGAIDVNIMTKIDRERTGDHGEKLPPEFSLAKAALRGFARSDLQSSVVFSAGMNQGLYAYAAEFEDFFPDAARVLKKRIILKVSDYRSALIQGKFLAKKGLWVSEHRIESGLNCGGHAFATKGHLAGPILEEFKENRRDLIDQLHAVYAKALEAAGRTAPAAPLPVKITYQGGIGTPEEDSVLREYYELDGTGWGTPFLLVPEVCNVDDVHLQRLCDAEEDEVQLTRCSPLGVPFWNLRSSGSEELRRKRIDGGTPGSPCPRKYLVSTTEFGEEPLCLGAEVYQVRKVEDLIGSEPDDKILAAKTFEVFEKACLCRDLAGGALIRTGLDPRATPAVCCGPNIVDFTQVFSLKQMVDHIYGRCASLVRPGRPHLFVKELHLYMNYMREELRRESLGLVSYPADHFAEYTENLLTAINYYQSKAGTLAGWMREEFLNALEKSRTELAAGVWAAPQSVG